MQIKLIAFDSFGIKSSCVFIKTDDCSITIDPGIAFETGSFPLPLHRKILLERKYRTAIKDACKKSDVIILTHYHYDHHIPEAQPYKNKLLLIKDPKRNINKSQKERAALFLGLVKNTAKEVKIADSKKFSFGSTTLRFSKPLWHGVKGTNLGMVTMVTVKADKKLVYSSDLNGPYIERYADLIIRERPDIIILDGAPTYLLGFIMSFANLKRCIKNTIKIIESTNAKIILDHHLLRDYRYKDLYYEVYKKANESGKRVVSGAEILGRKPMVLEGYHTYGPTRWRKWERMTFSRLDEMIRHAKLARQRG